MSLTRSTHKLATEETKSPEAHGTRVMAGRQAEASQSPLTLDRYSSKSAQMQYRRKNDLADSVGYWSQAIAATPPAHDSRPETSHHPLSAKFPQPCDRSLHFCNHVNLYCERIKASGLSLSNQQKYTRLIGYENYRYRK